ncbi:MbtH family protein [Rhizobium sp. TRM95111]|uniref:MbtH family protein n=1 Tax=Rhizobium alarense TaxID=2846851 RepID=UPI001F364459|nr:MbtH family protein [Rhizobium alarense]MCF3639293.1 MbtH family protein [Rhizobium alarense]
MVNGEYINPFDDDRHRFLAVVNEDGQFSLWPDFAAVPPGWSANFGPADRTACLEHIGRVWKGSCPAEA